MHNKVKILRLSEYAKLPKKGSAHAVGWDVFADLSRAAAEPYKQNPGNGSFEEFLADYSIQLNPHEVKILPSGIKVELAEDMEMDIKSRSGLFSREGILAVGTIDPDYRGEVGIMMMNLGTKPVLIKHGERLCQAVFRKVYNQNDLFVEVKDESGLSSTERGGGGFGSTGKK